MTILVLGGTRFVGRHIVEALLAAGHEPTLFHRGVSGADLFPECRHILGDRTADLDRLEGEWDAMIDVSAYRPAEVSSLAGALQGRAGRAAFISTISVYSDFSAPGIREDSPRIEWTDREAEVDSASYGGLKVLCEEEFLAAWGRDACILRPCIVAGPYDPTDRFTWWALGRGPIPARQDQPVQWIDARDLAAFAVRAIEEDLRGPFNVGAPPMTLRELAQAGGGQAGEAPEGWSPPMTLPEDGSKDGIFQVDAGRAREAGLGFRSLAETIEAVRAWHAEAGSPALRSEAPAAG